MSPLDAILGLRAVGGDISLANGELRLRAPRGALTDAFRKALGEHRDALRELVRVEQLLHEAGIAWEHEVAKPATPGCCSKMWSSVRRVPRAG